MENAIQNSQQTINGKILSFFPKGAEIVNLESNGPVTVKFGNATYTGSYDKKGMPIGKWTRTEGENIEVVRFYVSYTQDRRLYTNAFVVLDYVCPISNTDAVKVSDGELVRGNAILIYKVILATRIFLRDAQYERWWKDDKRHGNGTLTSLDGHKYEGDWKDDKMNGKGTLTWPDGREYTGEWKYGKMHGKGTLTWLDGTVYKGDFKNNERDGMGIYKFSNGGKYYGEWKDSEMHGRGILISPNGDLYYFEEIQSCTIEAIEGFKSNHMLTGEIWKLLDENTKKNGSGVVRHQISQIITNSTGVKVGNGISTEIKLVQQLFASNASSVLVEYLGLKDTIKIFLTNSNNRLMLSKFCFNYLKRFNLAIDKGINDLQNQLRLPAGTNVEIPFKDKWLNTEYVLTLSSDKDGKLSIKPEWNNPKLQNIKAISQQHQIQEEEKGGLNVVEQSAAEDKAEELTTSEIKKYKKALQSLVNKNAGLKGVGSSLNSSLSQNNLQLQQHQASDYAQASDNEEEKIGTSSQKGKLDLGNAEMLNPYDIKIQMDPLEVTDNSTK
jgi:hypothetical protein